MWKDSIRNIVVIFQPNILRIVGFYVGHSAIVYKQNNMYAWNNIVACFTQLNWIVCTQKSYQKYKKLINSKLPSRPKTSPQPAQISNLVS